MRKLLLLVLPALVILGSCSAPRDAQFAKRKYTKNFKHSYTKYKEPKSPVYSYYTQAEETPETELLAEVPQMRSEPEVVVEAQPETRKEVTKPTVTLPPLAVELPSDRWIPEPESTATPLSMEQHTLPLELFKPQTSDTMILLIILAILIPPLAVFLYEDDISINFVVALLLWIFVFTWIFAVIFALLVIYDKIDLR